MRTAVFLGVLMAITGCDSSSDSSSCGERSALTPLCCPDAIAHYYAAGCTYKNGAAVLSQSNATGACENLQLSAFANVPQNPPNCMSAFVTWFDCNDRSGCGCQSDFDALEANCNH
jgi:hypothetical protein